MLRSEGERGPSSSRALSRVRMAAGDLVAGEGGEVDLDVAPGAEAGAAGTEGAGAWLRGVMEAEDVGFDGETAAALAVGKDVTAFHGSLRKRKKPARGGLFLFLLYKSRISG